MKKTILITLTALSFVFIGCGNDEGEAQEAAYKNQIVAMKVKWEEYKKSINGNYEMTYEESGYVSSPGEQSVEVRDGSVTNSKNSGSLTMDVLFQAVLNLFDSKHCELDTLVFEDARPVIKRYISVCDNGGKDVTHTMDVKSFNSL